MDSRWATMWISLTASILLAGLTRPAHSATLSRGWSPSYRQYIQDNVPRNLVNVDGSQMEVLCPKYDSLRTSDKEIFWSDLFEMLSLAESDHVPTTRFREAGLGRDSVTGTQIFSEGLLQLSYSDARNWRCDFNWSQDRSKGLKDSSRTIFDPYKQFDCAFKILNGLMVGRGMKLTARGGNYWSTLKPGSPGYRRMAAPLKNRVKNYCY